MDPAHSAVFVDLDRTLLRTASGPVLQAALMAEGVLTPGRGVPGDFLLYAFYDRFGETVPFIALARAAARIMRGRSAEETRRAGKAATAQLIDLVQPYALEVLAEHRRAGRRLVLATTTPIDLIDPLAVALGFDAVVATKYQIVDGLYTGRLDGGFVWGAGKRAAVRRWASEQDIDLASSHAYSDSLFDVPLLSLVGHPHTLNADPRLAAVAVARRWPLEYWDRAPGVPSILGLEPYHLIRPFVRTEAFPYARFDITGVDHVPPSGPVLLASNHRSYFDVAALAIVAARIGRPVRFMGKQELFDAPVIGRIARALGGIPVNRDAHSGAPMREAAAALRGGEVVLVLPQGTIPRGDAFFDPVLRGKTGVARLAAETGAAVLPVGLWGTEQVWPRSSSIPNMTTVLRPPMVTVRVGAPVSLGGEDAVADTQTVMAAIVDLLPDEAREEHTPTADELSRTRPKQ
ncbi:MAG TPA: HAD-IB family hydrolase [Acidimicrobiales bacterium]|jgi:putative phosphoserine phosphatase/1-acylglycerol-3-phosphate O-acyltransferase